MRKRTAGRQVVDGRVYGRFWLGGDRRESVPLPAVSASDSQAVKARCELIADVAARLVAAGRGDRARDMAVQLGAATNKKRIDAILGTVKTLIEKSGPIGDGISMRKFGEKWTSGDLARIYRDHVRQKRTADDDKQILEQYVYPVAGDTPVRAFQLTDAEIVMAQIGEGLSRARRRHVAQVMHRLLKLAVYPAKIIVASPLPPGFLPKLGSDKAKQYLYPDEDAKLMACMGVPLVYRLFYGVLDREGMRFSELASIDWAEIDLEHGAIRLDENKTDDPRGWALDASVTLALSRWKEQRPDLARPFAEISDHHAALRFREEHLRKADVTRVELFEATEVRKPIRVHDLRATFVTISLANGKTETWVQDRTGHKSTLMIARYRRAARSVEELKLGPLAPLYYALDWSELALVKQQAISQTNNHSSPAPSTKAYKTSGDPSGTRTRTPFRAADFKSEARASDVAPGRESKPSDDLAGLARHGLADTLPIEPLGRGRADLQQIRTDWSAFEAHADAMEAADFDLGGEVGQ